jgi:hypothetical protein
MIAYKAMDVNGNTRIYVQYKDEYLLCATPTLPTGASHSYYFIDTQVKMEKLVEVNLVDEKWVHPHLLKSIREALLKES